MSANTAIVRSFRFLFAIAAVVGTFAKPAVGEEKADPSLLTLDRIFQGGEFDGQSAGAIQWHEHRGGYTTLEKPEAGEPGRDLVWHDSASDRKEVLVPAHHFVPRGEEAPLSIESYAFSVDDSKL